MLLDVNIQQESTLLFFDEIQECFQAIESLRYFYENFPSLHVIAAGSLLDFAVEKIGVPVGRVESLYCYPLSFFEFLVAVNQTQIAKMLLSDLDSVPLSDIIHDKILDLLGQYLALGGMPEAVARWVETRQPKQCFSVYQHLLDAYRQDFSKYCKEHQIKYVSELFDGVPRQLGQAFKYSHIHGEYKKRELAPALDLLCTANVAYKVHHTAGHGVPLGAECHFEWCKVIGLDIVICQVLLGLDLGTWFLDPKVQFVNRGAITEAFIGQELLSYSSPHQKMKLYYWKQEQKQSQAEVDFLCEHKGQVVPIEVKSGDGRTLKSLHLFLQTHASSPYGIRFSSRNSSQFQSIFSRPLYYAVSLAHEDQKESLHSIVL